jgi:carbamoyltransferase
MAHLASAFLVSPFEEAIAVSVDGFGDFVSAGWGVGSSGTSLTMDGRVWFPHSLGAFYRAREERAYMRLPGVPLERR